MLQVNDLCVRYGAEEVLREVNLHVSLGEAVCVTGRSGSGKTTLLRAVMGFVPPAAGSITVGGTVLTSRTAESLRRKIAWMPQNPALPTEWVGEMVRMPFSLRANRKVAFSEQRLLDCFARLGLEPELLQKRTHEISGGQNQRIMLAVSALLDKPLLVIDEPTSALDPASGKAAVEFVRSLAEEGRAVLAVSHDPVFQQGCSRTFNIGI